MKIIYKELKTNNLIVKGVIAFCFIITAFSMYIAYKASDNANKIMYVVSDKGIVVPLNRIETKEQQIVVLQGAIANFIDKYYTIDQYTYKDKQEKILWLASEDFVKQFEDKVAKGWYNRFLQTGAVQTAKLQEESLKIGSWDAPWTVQYNVIIEVMNGGNKKTYIVHNQATLYSVKMNYPYNPFGVLYTNFLEGKPQEYKE